METVEINGREYTFHQIGVFDKATMFAALQKQFLPAMKDISPAEGEKVMDIPMTKIVGALSERFTPEVLKDLVLPMFKLAQVVSVEHGRKVDSQMAVNTCFDDMDDFLALVLEVAKSNFLPSIKRVMQQYGFSGGDQPQME